MEPQISQILLESHGSNRGVAKRRGARCDPLRQRRSRVNAANTRSFVVEADAATKKLSLCLALLGH